MACRAMAGMSNGSTTRETEFMAVSRRCPAALPDSSESADLVGEFPGNELELDVLGVERAAGR